MRLVGHAVSVEEIENSYKMMIEKLKGRVYLRDLDWIHIQFKPQT
jgi:hypothetical protein